MNWLKTKIQKWLEIRSIDHEIRIITSIIKFNEIEEYIKNEKSIEDFIKTNCKEYGIINPESIKQITKNQKIKAYLDYNNKILPESMKELFRYIMEEDLKFIK